VRTEHSGEFRARRVIVTVPAGVLKAPAELPAGIRFDPEPRDQLAALEKIGMGLVVKIVLRLRPHFGEILRERFPARGSGLGEVAFLLRRGAPFPTWWSAAPVEVPMITACAGGPAAQALRRSSRREVLREAVRTIASLLDVAPDRVRRLLLAWHMQDWNRDPCSRGAYSYPMVGGASAPAALARPVRDTLFFAGEATEPEQNGTVAGAIASGRRVASRILT
jgi:monoamine oxidase